MSNISPYRADAREIELAKEHGISINAIRKIRGLPIQEQRTDGPKPSLKSLIVFLGLGTVAALVASSMSPPAVSKTATMSTAPQVQTRKEALEADSQVPVRNPSGIVVTIPASQTKSALMHGYRLASNQELAEQGKKNKEQDELKHFAHTDDFLQYRLRPGACESRGNCFNEYERNRAR